MSLRGRLLASAFAFVVGPLLVLALGIRFETAARLERQYVRRVDSLVLVIEGDLRRRAEDLRSRLVALRESVREDDRLRLALAGDESLRSYRLDWAGRAAALTGLDLLQLQDEADTDVFSVGPSERPVAPQQGGAQLIAEAPTRVTQRGRLASELSGETAQNKPYSDETTVDRLRPKRPPQTEDVFTDSYGPTAPALPAAMSALRSRSA